MAKRVETPKTGDLLYLGNLLVEITEVIPGRRVREAGEVFRNLTINYTDEKGRDDSLKIHDGEISDWFRNA